jgi:hypothetical protein
MTGLLPGGIALQLVNPRLLRSSPGRYSIWMATLLTFAGGYALEPGSEEMRRLWQTWQV